MCRSLSIVYGQMGKCIVMNEYVPVLGKLYRKKNAPSLGMYIIHKIMHNKWKICIIIDNYTSLMYNSCIICNRHNADFQERKNNMTKIFIDGSAGTTGLRIHERLSTRIDLQILEISEQFRKDDAARCDFLNQADVAFLCLPDAAAMEAAKMVTNPNTVVIDTSTAHRTNDDWAYGFPELTGLREKIQQSKRIANPGCHASGFISLAAPLVESGLISQDTALSCFSLTGYSGGGKKMIADYEANPDALQAPRMYGLTQKHKHLPEMQKLCGLETAPVFSPIVSSYYAGMEVVISLFGRQLYGRMSDVKEVYRSYYKGALVKFVENGDEAGFLDAGKMAGLDTMEISVYGNDERMTLVSRFDNLGKGASGAAIQNMNIALGLDETTGLCI